LITAVGRASNGSKSLKTPVSAGDVYPTTAGLAGATAGLAGAIVRLVSAIAGLAGATAGLVSAIAGLAGATAGLVSAIAGLAGATAGLVAGTTAGLVAGAIAGLVSAIAGLAGAIAGLTSLSASGPSDIPRQQNHATRPKTVAVRIIPIHPPVSPQVHSTSPATESSRITLP